MVLIGCNAEKDVIFLIEGTSNLGLHYGKFKPYLEKFIEYFNDGPVPAEELAANYGNTNYWLVTYGTTDSRPGSAVNILCRTNNSRTFLNQIINFKCHGGGGEWHALLADGMGRALEIFDPLQQGGVRECNVQRYCIIVAMSPPYPGVGSFEGDHFSDLTVEQLADQMGQFGVNVSVIAPHKTAIFQSIFDKANQDNKKSLIPKDFIKEKNHMVCLKGIDFHVPEDQAASVQPPTQPVVSRIPEVQAPSIPIQQEPERHSEISRKDNEVLVQEQLQPKTEPGVTGGNTAPSGPAMLAWTGCLKWQESIRTDAGPTKVSRVLSCHVSTPPTDNLQTDKWPKELTMQLIPQSLLTSLGTLLHNSRTVSFHFAANDPDSLRALYRVMATTRVRFAGCVHFMNSATQCDLKILLLIFSPRKRAFVGLIPLDQDKFMTAMKALIADHKSQQLKLRAMKMQQQKMQQLQLQQQQQQQQVQQQQQQQQQQLQQLQQHRQLLGIPANQSPQKQISDMTSPMQIPNNNLNAGGNVAQQPQKINNLSNLLAQPAPQLTSQQQQILQNPEIRQIIKQQQQMRLQQPQQAIPQGAAGSNSSTHHQNKILLAFQQLSKSKQQQSQQLQQLLQLQQQQQQQQQVSQPQVQQQLQQQPLNQQYQQKLQQQKQRQMQQQIQMQQKQQQQQQQLQQQKLLQHNQQPTPQQKQMLLLQKFQHMQQNQQQQQSQQQLQILQPQHQQQLQQLQQLPQQPMQQDMQEKQPSQQPQSQQQQQQKDDTEKRNLQLQDKQLQHKQQQQMQLQQTQQSQTQQQQAQHQASQQQQQTQQQKQSLTLTTSHAMLAQLAQRSQSQGQLNTQPLSTVPRPQQLPQVSLPQETMIQSKVASNSVLTADDSNLYDLLS